MLYCAFNVEKNMVEQEILGYLAAGFVMISLTMANMKYLRYLNLVGSVLFVSYGVINSDYPVVLMNTFAILVNCYHLWKLHTGVRRT